ncbi:Hypothetical predicted protein [Olea europaea subsp. europaea]|uniref:Uncharacterized protein n=1 Tax=Olea europaea subsp. europaea TaxID=158383 RepID=A0A8S0U9V5_OLEEU|nr:Hypothetical predicted protein [Olea europaea subsp. europaea]
MANPKTFERPLILFEPILTNTGITFLQRNTSAPGRTLEVSWSKTTAMGPICCRNKKPYNQGKTLAGIWEPLILLNKLHLLMIDGDQHSWELSSCELSHVMNNPLVVEHGCMEESNPIVSKNSSFEVMASPACSSTSAAASSSSYPCFNDVDDLGYSLF